MVVNVNKQKDKDASKRRYRTEAIVILPEDKLIYRTYLIMPSNKEENNRQTRLKSDVARKVGYNSTEVLLLSAVWRTSDSGQLNRHQLLIEPSSVHLCALCRAQPATTSAIAQFALEVLRPLREKKTILSHLFSVLCTLYSIKNLYISPCTVLGGEIFVSSRLGPRLESAMNMNSQAHDNISAPTRQNDDDDGCSKCTATPPILIL